MIYTIGYQRITPDYLANLMDSLRVDALIDVRSVPQSRKKGFSRKALASRFGARYEWRGDTLGGRGDGPTLRGITDLANEKRNVMLMCMEHLPGECHRYHAIAVPLKVRGVDIWHVLDDEVIETSEVMRAIASEASGQSCTYLCASLPDWLAART
jgi:uncharacterized protein (DUF488 family)